MLFCCAYHINGHIHKEMQDSIDKFSGTANEFIKSVSKLSLYSDWLLLKKIKGSVSSGEQMRPSDERLTMETTQQAIQFILQYASLIDTVKRVDAQKESVPPIEYTQYRVDTLSMMKSLQGNVTKMKLFLDHSSQTVNALQQLRVEGDKDDCDQSSAANNSFSFE